MYDRGPAWENFFRKGERNELLVGDSDIEAYDWDNQAVVLTEAASKRIAGDFCDRALVGFVVTVDDKPVYGGTCIESGSQMAINHPVLFSKSIEGRTVILIRPRHEFCARPNYNNGGWDEITSPAISEHFEALHKFRKPWSEEPYQKIRKSVIRLCNLTVREEKSALIPDFDLEGNRPGKYELFEYLEWNCGNEGRVLARSTGKQMIYRPAELTANAYFRLR